MKPPSPRSGGERGTPGTGLAETWRKTRTLPDGKHSDTQRSAGGVPPWARGGTARPPCAGRLTGNASPPPRACQRAPAPLRAGILSPRHRRTSLHRMLTLVPESLTLNSRSTARRSGAGRWRCGPGGSVAGHQRDVGLDGGAEPAKGLRGALARLLKVPLGHPERHRQRVLVLVGQGKQFAGLGQLLVEPDEAGLGFGGPDREGGELVVESCEEFATGRPTRGNVSKIGATIAARRRPARGRRSAWPPNGRPSRPTGSGPRPSANGSNATAWRPSANGPNATAWRPSVWRPSAAAPRPSATGRTSNASGPMPTAGAPKGIASAPSSRRPRPTVSAPRPVPPRRPGAGDALPRRQDSCGNPAANAGRRAGPAGTRKAGWSGRWDSNPRRSAWEADTLPLSYARFQCAYRSRPPRGLSIRFRGPPGARGQAKAGPGSRRDPPGCPPAAVPQPPYRHRLAGSPQARLGPAWGPDGR